ncbi:MAG: hypothetical protein D3926_06135 [Desulfobacteraceae bacterium]|nr:MAG: hypothetical protein D3926_06135 [Desulfobacteraceae bacterium]
MTSTETGVINVCVASLYRSSGFQSEIVSQAVLNEPVDIIDEENRFVRIRMPDGYEGWIDHDQLVEGPAPDRNLKRVRSHFIRLYRHPDTESQPVRDAVIGCELSCIDEADGWVHVQLPDGDTAWTQAEQFGPFPEFRVETLLDMAAEFLGYQYLWGGKTPKGLDCSGFVQLVFSCLGQQLPRDAWMQQQHGTFKSSRIEDASAGELLFFGKQKDLVTHVGISLGQGRLIHSQGFVRINSLNPGDADYHPVLESRFINVNHFQANQLQ